MNSFADFKLQLQTPTSNRNRKRGHKVMTRSSICFAVVIVAGCGAEPPAPAPPQPASPKTAATVESAIALGEPIVFADHHIQVRPSDQYEANVLGFGHRRGQGRIEFTLIPRSFSKRADELTPKYFESVHRHLLRTEDVSSSQSGLSRRWYIAELNHEWSVVSSSSSSSS